jgi:hypothetical protein
MHYECRTWGFATCFVLVSRLTCSSALTYFPETMVDFQRTTLRDIREDRTLRVLWVLQWGSNVLFEVPLLTCRFQDLYPAPTFCTDLSQQNVHVIPKEFIECTHRCLMKACACIIIFILSWDVRIEKTLNIIYGILSVIKSTNLNADNVSSYTKIPS